MDKKEETKIEVKINTDKENNQIEPKELITNKEIIEEIKTEQPKEDDLKKEIINDETKKEEDLKKEVIQNKEEKIN